MKKVWIVVIIVIVSGVAFIVSSRFGHQIPPVDFTHTSMAETSFRIGLYKEANGKLPDNLEQLPKREGYINSIIDGWKKELQYSIKDAKTVVLISYGEDGKAGGTNSASDIVKEFEIK